MEPDFGSLNCRLRLIRNAAHDGRVIFEGVSRHVGKWGLTLLQAASRKAMLEVIAMLLKGGATIIPTLMLAVVHFSSSCREQWSRACARPSHTEKAGVNSQGRAFGIALQAELLAKGGAAVTAQGGLYSIALLAAAVKRHEPVARLVLQNRAKVNSQQRVTQTLYKLLQLRGSPTWFANALQAASRNGYEKVVDTLRAHEANVNCARGYVATHCRQQVATVL